MSKKRDILFLCQFFYPEYISSATLPFDTAKALSESGFNVGVLCGFPKEYNNNEDVPLNEKIKGINIKRLKYFQLRRSNVIGRLVNYFSFTFSVLLNFTQIRNYKSLIVYSNPPVLPIIAYLAKKIYGTKIVFVSYDVYPEIAIKTNSIQKKSIVARTMNFINRRLFKNVDKVIALSKDMKEYLLKNRNQLTEDKIEIIPNWYEDKRKKDTQKSYHNDLFKSLKPKENLVVSYFGNMGIAQDLETLIGAIKHYRNNEDISFLFAGHGSKMEKLKDIIQTEKIKNVYIYDFLHGTDFQDALNISDTFIVSLAGKVTGLAVPSKTYSYMMAGKSIIAIMDQHADISKQINVSKAGFGVSVGDVSSLVSSIKTLKDNPNDRKNMGENSRHLFEENYTTQISTNKYIELFKKLLGDKECLTEKIY